VLELRHGKPDDAESGHDSDEDRSEEGNCACRRVAEVTSRIVQVRLPGAVEIDERVEGEESRECLPVATTRAGRGGRLLQRRGCSR